jgi:hypothetical protein
MIVSVEGRKTILSEARDVVASHTSAAPGTAGRHVMVAIGIDRYRHWPALRNAVGDAEGAAAVLRQLGFEDVVPPLLNGQATSEAIQGLVTDELTSLAPNDNLIVFFAGHGGTRSQRVGQRDVRTGYLIPADGAAESNRVQSWIEIDPWLSRISRLPPRHILVILDACFSGIALSSAVKWGRASGALLDLPFAAANARPSRLVITSALDDQRAMDSGPRPGHSLFTGCLIEALTGGVSPVGVRDGRQVIIGSELGRYVRHRVSTYEGRPGWAQTPDLGSFDFDERGEMLIPVLIGDAAEAGRPALARASTKQIAAQPETALAADTVVEQVAEVEAAAIDAMAADAAAIEAAAIAAMAPRVAVGAWKPPTAGLTAVELEPPPVEPDPERRRQWSIRVTLTITIAVAAALVAAILREEVGDSARRETLRPAASVSMPDVPPDAASAQPPPADSAVAERPIGPAADPIRAPALAPRPTKPPPTKPPVSAATIKRNSGAPTRAAAVRQGTDPQPVPAAAPRARGPAATAPAAAAPSICPTWIQQPKGAEVSWSGGVATLPVRLPLPCHVEVTLVVRWANHVTRTRKVTATPDGEPVIVRLPRIPGPAQLDTTGRDGDPASSPVPASGAPVR